VYSADPASGIAHQSPPVSQNNTSQQGQAPRQGFDGIAQSRVFAAWCWDHLIALMATDTFAVEVLPVLPTSDFHDSAPEDNGMMHQELIAKPGLPLGELRNLAALAQDCRTAGRWDSLLTVTPF
jgi:hypothetical protein